MNSKRRWLLGLVLVLTSVDAGAQEPEDAERFRDQYESALAEMKLGKPENFERCADMLIALYNEFSDFERADEILFNAAVCAEMGGRMGEAIQLRAALLERHPTSHLAESTLEHLAYSHATIANYEKSATYFEQYAAKYPKEVQAPDALQNAYLFRVGLDQTDAALKDLDAYERLYAGKHAEQAAKIFWSRRTLLESAADRRKHALAYIDRYGRSSERFDRWVVAQATVAQIDWGRSCSEPLLLDSCISVVRQGRWYPGIPQSKQDDIARAKAAKAGTRPLRCGAPGLEIVVHTRKSKLADDARERFRQILAALDKAPSIGIPEDDPMRQREFVDAWAMALVHRADHRYETEFLRLQLVGEHLRQFDGFVRKKNALADELTKQYAEVERTDSVQWQIVAAARVGMLHESFADQLDQAKVPRGDRSEKTIDQHCSLYVDTAWQIRDEAIDAWRACVELSTKFQYFDETSRLCEAHLAALSPVQHPATHELFGESVYAPTRMRTVGVQPEQQ